MKHTPEVALSYGPLHQLAMGPLKAALLNCAIKLKVFDLLSQARAAGEVAAALGLHPENTRRFLDALTTIDLLRKQGATYCNQPIAQAFLVSGSLSSVAALLLQTQNAGLNPLDKLERLLTHGPDADGQVMDFADEKIWTKEVQSSAGWVFGGVGPLVAEMVAGLPGFASFEKMLDMGCGHGAFTLYILEKNPKLHGVLLDRPAVLAAAAAFVDAYQAGDRVSYRPGDYLAEGIGEGYDLVFASATLNFAIGNLPALLGKVLDALKPGGWFVSFQDGMTNQQTKPETMLGAVIPSMMMGHDYCFPQGMIAKAAIDVGFQSTRSRTVDTPIGAMDIDMCQKGDRGCPPETKES
ncbi:Methyltransferase type 12 [Desulfarculus baarsii DSM 2075]|uniref:Methyltransferase type 12 n=1 Tax=Desulfarculus baarsii (strain ATCC 33931 / DSM 2075 / LMG 7858 / VKM B-1802 / 2st14) TaxID=644282 RepID=E1QIS1_DESB2|nr:methyltransferase dimerization domain-containing protein [Desulfarculus baarsii]ADK84494.1 Methyltransferase type 12 [Desulfarculus baarsii DSM 2075]